MWHVKMDKEKKHLGEKKVSEYFVGVQSAAIFEGLYLRNKSADCMWGIVVYVHHEHIFCGLQNAVIF